MSAVARPSAPARRSSMSTANCAASSRLLERTPVNCASLRVSEMKRSRAFTSASCPRPPVSSMWKLKPALAPSPRTAGGSSTSTRASRIFDSAALARLAMASAVWSGPGRSSQGFNLMKARPDPWSPPVPVETL